MFQKLTSHPINKSWDILSTEYYAIIKRNKVSLCVYQAWKGGLVKGAGTEDFSFIYHTILYCLILL